MFSIITIAFLFRTVKKNICMPAVIKRADLFPFLAVFSPFVAILLIRYFNAIFQIPLEYDNVAYHLPFVVEWYNTGNILPIYYSAFAGPLGYYPSNFELFDLWVIFPFGKDYFVNLLNFPLFPLLIIVIYAIGRNLNFSPKIALLSAAIFIYMPQTFRQMGVPLVDLFFVLTFATSIYFLQEFWKNKQLGDIFLFGVSLGLFVGTKYLGVPYIFPLLLLSIALIGINFWKTKLKIWLSFMMIFIGSFLGGGFWYIRNWIDVGNPIFPAEVKILDRVIFHGYYELTEKVLNFSLLHNVTSYEKLKEFLRGFFFMVGAEAIFSPIIFALIIVFFIFSLLRIPFTKKKNPHISNTILSGLFIGALIFYFYFYWKAPYTYNNLIPNVRYAMMFLLIASLACGFIVSRMTFFKNIFYLIVFSIIAYNLTFLIAYPDLNIILNDRLMIDYKLVYEYWGYFLVYLSLLLLLYIFFIFLITKKKSIKKYTIMTLLLVIILGGTSVFFQKVFPIRENLRYRFEDAWYHNVPTSIDIIYSIVKASEWFNSNAPDAKIAYTGFNFHYHLYGRNLQREVDYININECEQCRYGDYKNSLESIRRSPNFDHWFSNLKIKNKNYLIITPYATDGVKSWEFEWVKEKTNNFKLAFQEKEVYIYNIIY